MISCSDGQSTAPDTTERVRVLMDIVVDADEPLLEGKFALVHADQADQSDTTQSLVLLSPNCIQGKGHCTSPTSISRHTPDSSMKAQTAAPTCSLWLISAHSWRSSILDSSRL